MTTSNFNSATPRSAWWNEVRQDGSIVRVASQGYDVFVRFRERLIWRMHNDVGIGTRIGLGLTGAFQPSYISGLWNEALISPHDLRAAKAWIEEKRNQIGGQTVDGMKQIIDQAIDANRYTPSLLSFIIWFAFGAEVGVPFLTTYNGQTVGTYSVPADVIVPNMSEPPPRPSSYTGAMNVQTGSPTTSGGDTQTGGAHDASAHGAPSINPLDTPPSAQAGVPTWALVTGAVVIAAGVGGGVYYVMSKRNKTYGWQPPRRLPEYAELDSEADRAVLYGSQIGTSREQELRRDRMDRRTAGLSRRRG